MREQLNIRHRQAAPAGRGEAVRSADLRAETGSRGGAQAGGTNKSGAFDIEALRRRAKRPWVLRILAALGALSLALLRLIGRCSRKNIPLAIGVGLFVLLLIIAGYNAFFRQNQVARPVLFSTRADISAAQSGNKAHHPFVKQAISTEALQREEIRRVFAESPPRSAQKAGNDEIAALIAAAEKHSAAPIKSVSPASSAPLLKRPEAVKTGKIAVPQARPHARFAERKALNMAAGQERAQILRVQRALQKSGARNLRATGAWDAASRAALRRFQGRHGLVMTGQADKETVAKMRQLHLW